MPIPDYQTIMLPFLNLLSDQKEHKHSEIITQLESYFDLTQEEREALFSNGRQGIFYNRVGWARTYLKKAGLLESPKRGIQIITKRGLDILKQKPVKIDTILLKQFPEFIDFFNDSSNQEEKLLSGMSGNNNTYTPEEEIEKAYDTIRKTLAQDLIQKIKSCSPEFFEKLVVELLVKMGYGGSLKDAGSTTRYTKDEGIDGIIKEDKLGLDMIYIQAKRWEGNVGRPEIQKFVGALSGQGAKKGIFITTSDFSKDALEYQSKNDIKIVLINGQQLSYYMIDYNLGVSTVSSIEIKRLDSDYFGEE